MSGLPSRTRSLRKPAGDTGSSSSSRYGRAEPKDEPLQSYARPADPKLSLAQSIQSPSRLPTVRPSRPLSMSARPPNDAGSTSKRPLSMYGKPPSVTATTSARPLSISGRPPSATGSASMRPPSTRANTSKAATGGLQRASSLRVSNAASTAGTEPVKTDRSRPPLTASRHLRNPSISSNATSTTTSRAPGGHSRTKSSSTLLNSTTSLRPQSGDYSNGKPNALDSQMKKPAFNTLQQHFSPAKNLGPKPQLSTYLAPPSPSKLPSNIAISAETAKLQNELLQLHLLHRDAVHVKREWRTSAKRKLGNRFKSVVDKNEALIQLEVDETGKTNAIALKKWQDQGTPGWGLEEKIQILDEVITGVWNLGESGGKYPRIVRRFERWLGRCHKIMESRDSDEVSGDEIMFLETLGEDWKVDCQNLRRKLEGWRDHLQDLGSLEGGSSLAVTLNGARNLVGNMLMELGVMSQIERDAMAAESEWIRKMNEDDSEDNNIPTAGAIWRAG